MHTWIFGLLYEHFSNKPHSTIIQDRKGVGYMCYMDVRDPTDARNEVIQRKKQNEY